MTSMRVRLAHSISEMKPVPKTARVRKFATGKLGVRHDSVPSGVTAFCILTTERSGSSLLDERLAARWTRIRSDGEIFNPQHRGDRSFDEVFARTYHTDTGHRIIGSKVIRNQVSEQELTSILLVPDLRVVLLRRRNVLRQFVSLKIALKDRVWKQPVHSSRPDVRNRAVAIDVDELLSYEAEQNRTYEEYEGLIGGMSVHRVRYEDVAADLETELFKVGEFLGAGPPDKSLPLKFLHQNPEPLRELVSNYEKLRSDLVSAGLDRLVRMSED